MALIRGSKQKFRKQSTDVSTPAIVRPETVSQGISLQGAADVDENNPEQFYFHLLGGVPSQILLYLYGQKYNQSFYTELGEHNHGPGNLSTANVSINNHRHSGNVSISHNHGFDLEPAGSHNHSLMLKHDETDTAVDTRRFEESESYDSVTSEGVNWINEGGSHAHAIDVTSTSPNSQGFNTGDVSSGSTTHAHNVNAGVSNSYGVLPDGASVVPASGGTPRTYFDDLQIEIDGVDRTAVLLAQAGEAKFGDGTSGHNTVVTGHELDILPYIATPGQHTVKFSVSGAENGGKVRWNLYTQE